MQQNGRPSVRNNSVSPPLQCSQKSCHALGDPGKTDTDAFTLAVPNPVAPVHDTEYINGLWLSAGSTWEDSGTSGNPFV